MDKQPTIIIQNNTGADVPVKLLQYAGIPNSINATTTFRWDITAETFLTATVVSIQVRTNVSAAYQTFTAPMSHFNAQGVVNALNSLNLGTSWYTVETGGSTFIKTDNDSLLFGNLVISDPDTLNLRIDNEIGQPAGTTIILANGLEIYNIVSPVLFDQTIPVSVGILFQVSGTAPPTEPLNTAVIKDGETIYFASVLDGQPFNFEFTTEAGVAEYILIVNSF